MTDITSQLYNILFGPEPNVADTSALAPLYKRALCHELLPILVRQKLVNTNSSSRVALESAVSFLLKLQGNQDTKLMSNSMAIMLVGLDSYDTLARTSKDKLNVARLNNKFCYIDTSIAAVDQNTLEARMCKVVDIYKDIAPECVKGDKYRAFYVLHQMMDKQPILTCEDSVQQIELITAEMKQIAQLAPTTMETAVAPLWVRAIYSATILLGLSQNTLDQLYKVQKDTKIIQNILGDCDVNLNTVNSCLFHKDEKQDWFAQAVTVMVAKWMCGMPIKVDWKDTDAVYQYLHTRLRNYVNKLKTMSINTVVNTVTCGSWYIKSYDKSLPGAKFDVVERVEHKAFPRAFEIVEVSE